MLLSGIFSSLISIHNIFELIQQILTVLYYTNKLIKYILDKFDTILKFYNFIAKLNISFIWKYYNKIEVQSVH